MIYGEVNNQMFNTDFQYNYWYCPNTKLRPEGGGGGGVKIDFPDFTYLIRAAGDKQEEKNRTEIWPWGKVNLIFREQRQIAKFCTMELWVTAQGKTVPSFSFWVWPVFPTRGLLTFY